MIQGFPVLKIEGLRSNLANLPGLHLIIYGLLLILVMLYYPGGFAQAYHSLSARLALGRKGKALAFDSLQPDREEG